MRRGLGKLRVLAAHAIVCFGLFCLSCFLSFLLLTSFACKPARPTRPCHLTVNLKLPLSQQTVMTRRNDCGQADE